MKTNRNNKKIIDSYLKQLKTSLLCSTSMKKAFISEVKQQIAELENQIQVLAMEDLHREIGSPCEIAKGFESREDIEKFKEKAKKYTRTKVICWITLVLAIVAIAVAVIFIKSNDNFYAEIYEDSYVKESN